MGCLSTVRRVARKRGRRLNEQHALRKKGRHYGEGYQKALQISVRLLPLVGVLVGGREPASCQASQDQAQYLVSGYQCFCLVVGSVFSANTTAVQEGM